MTGDLALTSIPTDWREQLVERGVGDDLIRLLGACVAPRAEKRPANAAALVEQINAANLPILELAEPEPIVLTPASADRPRAAAPKTVRPEKSRSVPPGVKRATVRPQPPEETVRPAAGKRSSKRLLGPVATGVLVLMAVLVLCAGGWYALYRLHPPQQVPVPVVDGKGNGLPLAQDIGNKEPPKEIGKEDLALLGTGRAETQKPELKPTFGDVKLKVGFPNDPFTKELIAGGSIKTKLGGVNAYVAEAPDFKLYYEAGKLPLTFTVESQADTTLLINLPNGEWVADDDSGGFPNPLIKLATPMSGRYDIWVGTVGKDAAKAVLKITELK